MKKNTKNRVLVWLLALSLLLLLPGMTNEIHAETNPTPPPPPDLEAVRDSAQSNVLLMWSNGSAPEGWHYQWRLSSNPDMESFITDDSTSGIEYMHSIEFTETLRNLMGNIAYLAVRYVLDGPSSLASEWSNIYVVEIDDNGHISNVEPADLETNPTPTPSESPSSTSSDGDHEDQTDQATGSATQPSDTLPKTDESSGCCLCWLLLLILILLLLVGGLIYLNRKKKNSQQGD